ncbi:EAL domain-containing protein [Vibrio penaeicida]|uniref:Diguanylate phosphodiesterase n=1 Tax=Vibrio penaeicida TaxID=104609 RepID=A0AAV5NL01_9VIBR|nr:EAL domain-containing protein [Vibrio penaeicida]GLQ70883.1 diguanylate phosphodiesterase [Vibrio penaeicida]
MILNNREEFNAHCFIDDEGRHYAKYDNLIITSAFQAIMTPTIQPFAYEALARFSSETTGENIRPDILFDSEQISIAKKINLDRLTRAIHVRNFSQLKRKDLKLFLNVLPVSGEYNAFMAIKASLLEKRIVELGLSTQQIVMEIVESAAFDNQLLLDATTAMQNSGFQVAMDDFGVKSSDFNRLNLLKPEIVKIDRSLLLDYMAENKTALLEIVRVAKNIGAKLIIEGVEEEAQYNAMKALGIDFYQGYLFSTPEPLMCTAKVK